MEIIVIGLGKLRLPLAALFANCGHKVRGFDSSHRLRESLNSGKPWLDLWREKYQ